MERLCSMSQHGTLMSSVGLADCLTSGHDILDEISSLSHSPPTSLAPLFRFSIISCSPCLHICPLTEMYLPITASTPAARADRRARDWIRWRGKWAMLSEQRRESWRDGWIDGGHSRRQTEQLLADGDLPGLRRAQSPSPPGSSPANLPSFYSLDF